MARARLDQLLVARGAFASRARARDAVLRGCVAVDGKTFAKPGQMVDESAGLTVNDPAQAYVARSALKLKAALAAFNVDVSGKHALDVGQSTGGFTQVLLEAGAAHVTGVDVGQDQLDVSLAGDPRVTAFEGVNARDADALPAGPFDAAVIDVSFISLALVMPSVMATLSPTAPVIALFKPQFEVGKQAIGKGGLVQDEDAINAARETVIKATSDLGYDLVGTISSPIAGGDGNIETLMHFVPSGGLA
ncbi:MAG: TlyA family RNA methyltransferase [Pseudomonadota bacterium]